MNSTNPNPQGVQSKIAQYIAGEVRLDNLINHNRLSVPIQKRFRFEDTWITMNRTIGEAVLQHKPSKLIAVGQAAVAAVSERNSWDKSKKATEIQQKRRNAIAVINQTTREMTNGHSWPKMEDWLVCPDQKIRYSQFIVPFRKPNESEWFQKSVGKEIPITDGKIPAVSTPILIELPVAATAAPSASQSKPKNSISSVESKKQPDKPKIVATPSKAEEKSAKLEHAKPKIVATPNKTEEKSAKLEHAKSVVVSSCPSNYNTPGCFGPLPESDI